MPMTNAHKSLVKVSALMFAGLLVYSGGTAVSQLFLLPSDHSLVAKAATVDENINEWMPNKDLQQLVLMQLQKENPGKTWNSVSDITKQDMTLLKTLKDAPDKGSQYDTYIDGKTSYSLEGLQYATNLTSIEMQSNLNYNEKFFYGDITDLSPLENLQNLTYINFHGNRIKDVSPIAKLTNVTFLNLGYNEISDFSELNPSQYSKLNIVPQNLVLDPVTINASNPSYTMKSPVKLPGGASAEIRPFSGNGMIIQPTLTSLRIFYSPVMGMQSGEEVVFNPLKAQIEPGPTSNPYPNYTLIQNDFTYYMVAQAIVPPYDSPTQPTAINILLPYRLVKEGQPVTVHYVDENGNPIQPDKVMNGLSGEQYDATDDTKVDLPGYELVSVDGNVKGTFSDSKVDITVHYKTKSTGGTTEPNNPSSPSTPSTPEEPSIPNQPGGGNVAAKGEVVYSLNPIYLYRTKTFAITSRIVRYTKKPRINRPMFVVEGYAYSSAGRLRYKVKDVNHKSVTAGKTGYITTQAKYVLPVYYAVKHSQVTVINPNGINAYSKASLTGKISHYKQGQVLKIVGIKKYHLTTRFILSNGNYISANKKLVIASTYRVPKVIKVRTGINRYDTVNLNGQNQHYRKNKVLKVIGWAYSHPDSMTNHGALRYRVAGGYVTANQKFVTPQN